MFNHPTPPPHKAAEPDDEAFYYYDFPLGYWATPDKAALIDEELADEEAREQASLTAAESIRSETV